MSSKFRIGDKVRIVGNESGHGQKLGAEMDVYSVGANGTREWYGIKDTAGRAVAAFPEDLAHLKCPRDRLTDQLARADEAVVKAQAKAAETQAKIDFLDETGSEEFCEKEFKVYQALKVIEEGSGSRIEKARAIAKLVG